MERYTLQEVHYKNGENLAEKVRKTRILLGRREAPCRTAIKRSVKKIKLLGQVSHVKNKTCARRSITAKNIAAVAESVEENPGLSIPRRSLELGIPQLSLHRISHKDLGLKGLLSSVYTKTQAGRSSTSNETIQFQDRVISRRGDVLYSEIVKMKI